MKRCFKCGVDKELSEFYKHSKMADGHVNKCKECNKKDVRDNRASNVEYYRAYDVKRGNRQTLEDQHRYREQNPKKRAAHVAVGNAIRDGKLVPLPCEVCGSVDVHGHHTDYSRPLSVMWLCSVHHKAWHTEYGEGLNA
jgi:hypothetical protein